MRASPAVGSWSLVAMAVAGCAGDDTASRHEVVEMRTELHIGTTPVDLVVFETEAPGLTYINLHDDEQTSVEAGLRVLALRGGRVFELQHGGTRNIDFTLEASTDGTTYTFDPNRMFTDVGAEASLERYGGSSPEAIAAVRAFADQVVAAYRLEELGTIITLHNNTPEDVYSALEYQPGGRYETEALDVFVAEGSDPHDFFFVTDADLFDALRAEGFNVVLQDNAGATDDGSLSVYAAAHALPYANSEADDRHLDAQVDMLLALGGIVGPSS